MQLSSIQFYLYDTKSQLNHINPHHVISFKQVSVKSSDTCLIVFLKTSIFWTLKTLWNNTKWAVSQMKQNMFHVLNFSVTACADDRSVLRWLFLTSFIGSYLEGLWTHTPAAVPVKCCFYIYASGFTKWSDHTEADISREFLNTLKYILLRPELSRILFVVMLIFWFNLI